MNRKYTKEEVKIIKDFLDQKNESERIKKNEKIEWKIRGWINQVHYWLIAYSPVVTIIIGIITRDYWKALGFIIYSQIYAIAGNLRGLGLHIENLVEWNMKKRV